VNTVRNSLGHLIGITASLIQNSKTVIVASFAEDSQMKII
jgi:hypothetical protein